MRPKALANRFGGSIKTFGGAVIPLNATCA
jgi:hypothetical protein